MSFLKRLVGPGVIHSTQPTQAPNNPLIVICPQDGGNLGNDVFFHPLLGHVMTGNQHEMLTKFLNLNPPVFYMF